MAVFLFFGEWGLKGKFEKIPKISVIFALFWFVGSERDFLKNAARRVGIFPFCGTDIATGSQNAPPEL